ncbi:WSC domain-containing protein [Mycena metata]|uniref:WSC domain-containing protein n=1 Tax=Mycena metata TaxID=1033252 RepID=A0AAD7NGA6_9AGAR|nr:WSC domain-containing protein [Mycena metata]
MFAYRFAAVFVLAQLVLSQTIPTAVLQYKEWASIGCQGDSPAARALHHLVTGSSANMTVELCLDACAAGGFILGGLESGHECYCGNALLYVYTVPQGNCVLPCAGNASELCGGSQALNLYQFADTPFTTGPPSTVFEYKNWLRWACIDAGPPFPFGPLDPIAADDMTVGKCLDGCAAAGHNAAGLQDGQTCFCNSVVNDGNDQPDTWEETIDFDCQKPCLDNATEICGGLLKRFSQQGAISAGDTAISGTCWFASSWRSSLSLKFNHR